MSEERCECMMVYQDAKKGSYTFDKLPGNIRQMGEQPEERVYIEDYVVTYMHQIFRKKTENAVVILIGKKGEGEAAKMSFIYGAMEIELSLRDGIKGFGAEVWDKIYEVIGRHFQGAQILGWGCGVSMWDSAVEEKVRQIQERYFKQEGQIFFREDFGEKEEKIYKWQQGILMELSGYVIYYDKNPQMQEYMLLGQKKKSFEAGYQDHVTTNVRRVVQHKDKKPEPKKVAVYAAGTCLLLLTFLGANLLIQSTKKIDNLEKTIATLSDAAVKITEKPEGETTKKATMVKSTEKPTAKPGKTSEENPLVTEAVKNTEEPKDLEELVTKAPGKKELGRQDVKKEKKVKSTPVPKGEVSKEEAAKEQEVISSKTASYIVRAGDTLSQIVWRQYHTLSCLDMVKRVNNIDNSDKIWEGQTLVLPEYAER